MRSTHEPGEIVGERYRILGVLGRGGVGITYVAEDVETHERVALKQLQLWHQHDWKVLDLFQREARVLAGLAHERIPRYLGYLQLEENQQFYLVQQIAPGHPLPHWIGIGWRPTEAQARALAAQLLEVLVYLHSLSPPVIHRDIKPGNVIRTEDGCLSLVDFGAVRDTYQSTLEQGSTIAGTYGYMAPEQFRGHASPASDLYGVGATLIYLLSQRSPAELPERAGRIRFRRYVRVSRDFAGWLERMVAPLPEKRFGSAAAALRALSSLGKPSVRRTLVATAAATAVVLPVAAGAALLWPRSPAPGGSGVAATSTLAVPIPLKSTGRLKFLRSFSGGWSAVFDVSISPDGKALATASNDGSVKLWDLASGKTLQLFPGHDRKTGAICFTPDGKSLLSAGPRSVRLWDVAAGSRLAELSVGTQVTDLDVSMDGKHIAAIAFDGVTRVFDASSRQELFHTKQPPRGFAVAFSPAGDTLATGGEDGIVRIWDAQDGSLEAELRGHQRGVNDLAYSRDGKTLVSASDDGTVRVWAPTIRRLMHELKRHDDEVWAVALAPDGKTLASGDKQGLLVLWDAFVGEKRDEIRADSRGVIGLAFSPNGELLAAGGGSNIARVWTLREPSWQPPAIKTPVPAARFVPPAKASPEERLVAEARFELSLDAPIRRFSHAAELLSQAIEKNSRYAPAYVERARLEYMQGYLYGEKYRPESLERAHAELDHALLLDPKLASAHVARGYAFAFGGKLAEARKAADRARALAPDDARVSRLLMYLADREKRYDELFLLARRLLEQSDEVDDKISAYASLETVYEQRQEYDAADATYRSLLNLEPGSAWAKGNYANFLLWRGQYDDAIRYAKAALAQMDYPVGHRILARIYADKALSRADHHAKPAEVDELLDQADEACSRCAEPHYARGMIQLARGENQAGRAQLELALHFEPDHARAKQALGRK